LLSNFWSTAVQCSMVRELTGGGVMVLAKARGVLATSANAVAIRILFIVISIQTSGFASAAWRSVSAWMSWRVGTSDVGVVSNEAESDGKLGVNAPLVMDGGRHRQSVSRA
jgi:hypothetical protein